jgi:hypothetical protein
MCDREGSGPGRVNSESVSNEIDDNELKDEKQDEQRIGA